MTASLTYRKSEFMFINTLYSEGVPSKELAEL